MAINQWIGDAAPRTQIEKVIVLSTHEGASARIIINGKAARYTVPTADAGSKSAVVTGLATAITDLIAANSSLAGITVAQSMDDLGEVNGVTVTGLSTGVPFTFSVSGSVTSEVLHRVVGRAAKNNKQLIVLPGVPTGGTFTLTYFGQTTGAIAYNAAAATVQTDLVGLSTIGTGNVSVSGSAGGPWTVEWIGDFVGRDPEDTPQISGGAVPTGLITIDASSTTQTAHGAYCRFIQRGGGRRDCIQRFRIVGTATSGNYYLAYGQNRTAAIAYNASAATVQTALTGLASVGTGNAVVTGSYTDGFVVQFVGDLSGKQCQRLVADRLPGTSGPMGAGQFEVTRVDQGAEIFGAGSTLVQQPAILIAPTRNVGTPSAVTISITNPLTGVVHNVSWDDGATDIEVAARIALVPGIGSYNVLVSEVDDGYRLDMTGTFSGYSWSVDSTEDAADTGVVYCVKGGTASLLQDTDTLDATSWRVRFRSMNAAVTGLAASTITITGPSETGTTTTATFTSTDSVATINAALSAATIALVASETDATGTKAQRELIFTYTPAEGFGDELSSPSPACDVSLTCASTPLDVESLIVQQGSEGTNTIQELGYTGFPAAGTVSLKVFGDATVTANVGSESDDINSALTALYGSTTLEAREVYRDPSTNSVWIEWYGTNYHGFDMELIEITGNALTGTKGIVSKIQSAQPEVAAEQVITLRNATGGTFTITLEGQTTAALAWNSEAGVIQSALNALSNVAPGDLVVYGGAGGPWRVVFLSTYATGPDVDLMTLDTSSLTADSIGFLSSAELQAATSPEHFDEPDNWTLGLPATAQTLLYTNSTKSCKYGLSQAAITPAAIYFDASYTGEIGLPDYLDGAAVTLTKELTLGTAGGGTLNVYVGRGEGSGSSRIRLNTGGKQTLLIAQRTGTPAGEPVACQWRGTHASNVVEVYRGTVGVGLGQESATIATLRCGFISDQEGDATVMLGENVTLTDVDKSGGQLFALCAMATLVNEAGDATIDGTGAVTTVTVNGGTVWYSSTGTLTTGNCANGGLLSFDKDLRAKTVTNPINVYGDEADVSDKWGAVASLSVNYNRTTRQPNLGVNYRVARTLL